MKTLGVNIIVASALFSTISLFAGLEYPKDEWKVAPRTQSKRWSDERLLKAKMYWEELGSTTFMVVEDGYVVCEWGDTKKPIKCHSVRKSFLNALYGQQVSKGKIKISSTLSTLKIDDDVPPYLSDKEKKATVKDLLMSKSGVYHPASAEVQSMKDKRPARGSHPNGRFFYYNNWDFNALGTIYQQETGEDVFESFDKHISTPLGMQDFSLDDTYYIRDASSSHSAYAFKMSTRDRARFGLLYLRGGKWGSKQIVSKKWIQESTKPYSEVRTGIGYGYLWWVSQNGWHFGNKFNDNPFSARGHWGQVIMVVPSKKLVIVQAVDHDAGDEQNEDKEFNELLRLVLEARR